MKNLKRIVVGAAGIAAALLLGTGITGAIPTQVGATPATTTYAQAHSSNCPDSNCRGFCLAGDCANGAGGNCQDVNADGICDNYGTCTSNCRINACDGACDGSGYNSNGYRSGNGRHHGDSYHEAGAGHHRGGHRW